MDQATQRLMQGAAGATGKKTYVEDVFSIDCWTGDGSTKTINNGIDLAGEGGMVWIVKRNSSDDHQIFDTVRGVNIRMKFNSTESDDTRSNAVTSFNSNGFTVGEDCNNNGGQYVAYTFRRAPGFFDIIGYSGNSTNRTIAHNLEVTPKMTIVKKRDANGSGEGPWTVDHHSIRDFNGQTLLLNSSAAHSGNAGWFKEGGSWNGSQFPVGTNWRTNATGSTYIAYVFAGGFYNWEGKWFGDDEDDFIMKTDKYQGNANTNGPDVDLGFQPQFLLVKNADRNQDWIVVDSLRGVGATAQDNGKTAEDKILKPNRTENESTADRLSFINNGIKPTSTFQGINGSGDDHIYIAIRRPDPKVGIPVESGTDVFAMDTGNGSSTVPSFDSNFLVDWGVYRKPAVSGSNAGDWYTYLRLNFPCFQKLNSNAIENDTSVGRFDSQVGWAAYSSFDSSYQSWMWRRHKGFDVVNYKGNGTSNTDIAHSLYNTPRMIWVKRRNGYEDWCVYHYYLNNGSSPQNFNIKLNSNAAEYSSQLEWGSANSSTFTIGGGNNTNQNTVPYVALLFGDVEGICKIGSYAGSSSTVTVTTGFSPRFVIIKRATGIGQWSVFDTFRGWTNTGNDKLLELSDNGAQTSNYDAGAPTSTGFTVNTGQSAINNNGDRYIYYAHS